jgi:hypothetical protein
MPKRTFRENLWNRFLPKFIEDINFFKKRTQISDTTGYVVSVICVRACVSAEVTLNDCPGDNHYILQTKQTLLSIFIFRNH